MVAEASAGVDEFIGIDLRDRFDTAAGVFPGGKDDVLRLNSRGIRRGVDMAAGLY